MVRPLSKGKISVVGRALFDELGREVLLRGVNAGGRSKFAPFMPFDFNGETDFAEARDRFVSQISSFGVNVVRLQFSWEALEPEQGAFDETYLSRYVSLIRAFWARGVYVIVDFHQDVYASPFGGDGFPLWTIGEAHGAPTHDIPDGQWFLAYVNPAGPVARCFDRLWRNEAGRFDHMIRMWQHVARATGKEPGVIGFELINEPGWGTADLAQFEAEILPLALTRLGAAVDAAAPGHLIFAGGAGPDALMASTSLVRPDLARFVYAPHYYDMGVAIGEKYRDRAAPLRALKAFDDAGARMNAPAVLGEFGGSNKSPDQGIWMRDTYDALDALKMHATLWEISTAREEWNHEDFRLVDAEGNEQPGATELVRPYPRAIAGHVDSFRFDANDIRFELTVNDASDAASEVFLPRRHFTTTPAITVEGAAASFDASREVMTFHAKAKQWRAVVSAR